MSVSPPPLYSLLLLSRALRRYPLVQRELFSPQWGLREVMTLPLFCVWCSFYFVRPGLVVRSASVVMCLVFLIQKGTGYFFDLIALE